MTALVPDAPAPVDLPALHARMAHGDADAFAQLCTRFESGLWTFLFLLMGDEKAAREAYCAAWVHAAADTPPDPEHLSYAAWLYGHARQAALDGLRRLRTPGRIVAPPTVLDGLPDPQRETFLLREEADLTFREIGIIMNCGRETAHNRFRLAVAKLGETHGKQAS